MEVANKSRVRVLWDRSFKRKQLVPMTDWCRLTIAPAGGEDGNKSAKVTELLILGSWTVEAAACVLSYSVSTDDDILLLGPGIHRIDCIAAASL